MKKKILTLGVIVLLVSLSVILTGCGEKKASDNNKSKSDSVSALSVFDGVGRYINGYIWVTDNPKGAGNPTKYYLLDKEGKIIFQTEEHSVFTNVHSNYFICDETLYDTDAKKVDLDEYSEYKKDIGTDNFQRDILRLKKETESFDGTESDTIYMDLSNMSKISDVVDNDFSSYGKADPYSNGSSIGNECRKEYTNYQNNVFSAMSKKDFDSQINIKDGIYTCVKNNGFFTVYDSNKKQLYEPIEGKVLDLDCETKKVAYTDGKDIFVADINGNTTKIDKVDYISNKDVYICDDMLICRLTAGDDKDDYIILKTNGEKITMHE